MLFESQQISELERYINQQDLEDLWRWWAQHCESNGNYESAIACYKRAESAVDLVRVYCFSDDFASAADAVMQADPFDPGAAFHLARQYELRNDVKNAIHFFNRAGRHNHSVRLAIENEQDHDISNLAMMSNEKNVLTRAARYCEAKGMAEQAVTLFQKAGHVSKALDICFACNLFETLRQIADGLGDDSAASGREVDTSVLKKCSEFFIQNKQFDKAVSLLITGKKFDEALDMCLEKRVMITEEMAERITMSKYNSAGKAAAKLALSKVKSAKGGFGAIAGASDAAKAKEHNERRQALLEKLAKICKKQGNYHLATKKYTQAGDKVKAMKCLLKSGDTEKIIFFANVSRNRDIYVLAANYLQNMDWHNNPETMKAIIQFYTKARAFEQLSGFYDACSQVEIDEYRDYEKALGALQEANKFMMKSRSSGPEKQQKLDRLQHRISLVQTFVSARTLTKSDPMECVKMCHQLLETRHVDTAIRIGDVFALLVEHNYSQGNMDQAFNLIEQMRERKVILGPYLDKAMVTKIYAAVGITEESSGGRGNDVGSDGELDESIELDESLEESLDFDHSHDAKK